MNHISPSAIIPSSVVVGRFVIIEDGVVLSEECVIGDFVIIQANAKIGRNTSIGAYSKIGKRVVVGEHCSMTAYCEVRDSCVLGNRVIMGSRCTLSAGTIVEDDVIMKYSFVTTDTPVLSQNSKKLVGKLMSGSRFGANVIIMPGVIIGRNSEIGANSQVRQDVPDNEIWFGIPARPHKKIRPND